VYHLKNYSAFQIYRNKGAKSD